MSKALLTDFYQLTMAFGYFQAGMQDREASFYHSFRKNPFDGGFTLAAGLGPLIDFIDHFRFNEEDISYLRSLTGQEGVPIFNEPFLNFLREFRFRIDLDAVVEGDVVFPQEPLIRVTGPLIDCQLLESPLLNLINFPTLIATKAARVQLAAGEDEVMEFGLRRAQGIDGALTASRAAYIGGVAATSNLMAGKLFGIPVRGTHAHSWILAFDGEEEAFEVFSDALPSNTIFLVDTYNTLEGVKHAIEVGKRLKAKGRSFQGIRLDSGDLADLSIKARELLDAAGFKETTIVASNELDETIISDLKKQGAKVAVWGVGTRLVTGKEQPSLDGVYKLSALRKAGNSWEYKLKLSEQMMKVTTPGILSFARYFKKGEPLLDLIYDKDKKENPTFLVDPFDATRERKIDPTWERKEMLQPIYRKGKRVYELPSLSASRQHAKESLSAFRPSIKRFLNPEPYIVGMESTLYEKKVNLIRKLRGVR